MRWRRNRYTLLVVPDSSSPVRRLTIPSYLITTIVTLILLFLIALTIYCLDLKKLFDNKTDRIDQLIASMQEASSQYTTALTAKDTSISTMQSTISLLSDQVTAMQQQLDQMNELEGQVRELMGEPPEETEKTAKADSDKVEVRVSKLDSFQDRLQELRWDLELVRQRLAATPSLYPTTSQRITSRFGIRMDPFTHLAKFHAGIDFSGDVGDPVYATADGVVILSERDSAEGNNIKIDHGNGLVTRYMHLSKLIAKVGDEVHKGTLIGKLGSTGRSTGPHLHYEVFQNGTHIDPMPYLPISNEERIIDAEEVQDRSEQD